MNAGAAKTTSPPLKEGPLLRLAIETPAASMASDDFGCRCERSDRFVGMDDEIDGG